MGAPRCTALANALSDSKSRGTIAPTIQLLSRTDSRAMVYMDTMQIQIFTFFTTNFKQIYKFEVMCQELFMNDVINFGGTKTSLFLSYSSLEIFDPIGLARYKFPESESCLAEFILC